MSGRSAAEIEADLEATRAELARTVDALGDKLDVRPQVERYWPVALAAVGAGVVLLVTVKVRSSRGRRGRRRS